LVVAVDALGAGSFAPGLWRGVGKITGGFKGHGVNVKATQGGGFTFCLRITPSGAVAPGSKWKLKPTVITERNAGANGTGHLQGGGQLAGKASKVTLSGTVKLKFTVSISGHRFTIPYAFPASGTLPVKRATRTKVTGDIAVRARNAQRKAGFASNETGNYTARPVSRCSL
jgi:hypothetical protein